MNNFGDGLVFFAELYKNIRENLNEVCERNGNPKRVRDIYYFSLHRALKDISIGLSPEDLTEDPSLLKRKLARNWVIEAKTLPEQDVKKTTQLVLNRAWDMAAGEESHKKQGPVVPECAHAYFPAQLANYALYLTHEKFKESPGIEGGLTIVDATHEGELSHLEGDTGDGLLSGIKMFAMGNKGKDSQILLRSFKREVRHVPLDDCLLPGQSFSVYKLSFEDIRAGRIGLPQMQQTIEHSLQDVGLIGKNFSPV